MKFFPYLGLLAGLFLFAGCGDDDTDGMSAFTNSATVNGVETNVANIYVTNEFFDVDPTLYWLFFTGEGITVDDGDFEGTDDAFFAIAAVRAAAGGLPDGTYTVSDQDMMGVFGFGFGTFGEGFEFLDDDSPNQAATGTLTVGTSGSDRTFALAVTTKGGQMVTISFSGPLRPLDN